MYNYSRIIFKDNETPLNATIMNHLDAAIGKLATHSLFPSDLVEGDGISISSTDSGKVKISQKSDRVYSASVNRLEVVYSIPSDVTQGEIYLLLDEETDKLKGIYWGTICIFNLDDLDTNTYLKTSDDEIIQDSKDRTIILKNDE